MVVEISAFSNHELQGAELTTANGKSRIPSSVEMEVIATIQAIRTSDDECFRAILADEPARLMHYFILSTNGHVALRFSKIAKELGVDLRTMQRAFRLTFKMSMRNCQCSARLAYAKRMLRTKPPMKVAAIAAFLGYRVSSDFVRFFADHTRQTPSEWRSWRLANAGKLEAIARAALNIGSKAS